MDFDLDYRFTLNCEIDKESYRPCDSIRTQLLQLVACKNQLPLPVYLDRQKDLLEKYSINIDDPKGINTYINSAIHIFKNESSRNYSAKNWKSSLKKRIDDGLTIGDLLPMNNNLHFKNLQQLSAKFREHQNNRTICINTENNHQSSLPAYLNNFQPIVDPDKNLLKNKPLSSNPKNSPTRPSGLFKKKSHMCHKSIFYGSSQSSSESFETNELEEIQRCKEKIKKCNFMTGLDIHFVNQVKNKEIDEKEARQLLKEIRAVKFNDPMNFDGVDNSKLKNDPRLKGIEPVMIELIENEIVKNLDKVNWTNISGLEYAKTKIQQVAILPLKRPDLFIGIRSPPKGILLFGPPGTGKTMIGRCIASEANATFFSITSSTLTSKWVGDSEKAMKTLFKVARCLKPSVIFIDEIDSILRSRSDNENDSIRRLKTEFLAQFDGLSSETNDGLLIIGTTNRPQDLDEAVRRRFACKLYIMLPNKIARKNMILNNLNNEKHNLTDEQIDEIVDKTDNYSGSDMKNLCTEAAMYSFQDIQLDKFVEITKEEIRPINFEDFIKALNIVKSNISVPELVNYEDWNKKFGSDN